METIKYVGTATRRVITDKEWEVAGVTGQDTVVWDRGNGYTVDASKLSQAAQDAVKPDPFFVFSDRDGTKQGNVEQEVEMDVDLAKEYEANAKSNTSTDGTGLDEPAAPSAKKKRGE